MKKSIIIIALILALLGSSAACNTSGSGNTDTEKPETGSEYKGEESPGEDNSSGNDFDFIFENKEKILYSNGATHASEVENMTLRNNPEEINLSMTSGGEMKDLKKPQKEIFINGENIVLNYDSSDVYEKETPLPLINEIYGEDIYNDENGNTYTYYIGTDRLKQFFKTDRKEIDTSGKQAVSAAEAENIVLDMVSEYSDVDYLNKYERSYFKETEESYSIGYTLYICGYKTQEKVTVRINKYGDLLYYSSSNLGIYEYYFNNITEEDIINAEIDILTCYPIASKLQYVQYTISMGDDGYLYLSMEGFIYPQDETDVSGNVVKPSNGIVNVCIFYARIIPGSN